MLGQKFVKLGRDSRETGDQPGKSDHNGRYDQGVAVNQHFNLRIIKKEMLLDSDLQGHGLNIHPYTSSYSLPVNSILIPAQPHPVVGVISWTLWEITGQIHLTPSGFS